MRYLYFDFSFCIKMEVLLACMIAISTALGYANIVSILFAISFILAYAYSAKYVGSTNNNSMLLLLIGLCLFNVTADGFIDGGSFSFNYYKKVIMFLAFVLLMHFSAERGDCVSEQVRRIIEIVPVITGVFLIFSYYYLGNTATSAGGITLGFSNPNFAGMWLLHFFLYNCLFVIKAWCGGSKWRLLATPFLPIYWIMIESTRARSCLIGVLFFLILSVLGLWKKRANRLLIAGMTLFPIVYAIVYLQVVYSDWFNRMFQFLISDGKTLTARVGIWKIGFDAIGAHPIIGAYSLISNGTGVSQVHNTHVDVLASYGLLPFVIFLWVVYDSLIKVNSQVPSFYRYSAFCAFCAVIVMGSFEAAMVAGAMGMNLLTVGLLIIANNEEPLEFEL